MEAGIPFLEKLIVKLKSGDARSIHLNALPGRYARLDVYDFINISPSLHLDFVKNILSGENFKLNIKIDPAIISLKTKEERDGARRAQTRLNHLYYQEQDEYLEHGTRSFAFGFPLLIKKDPNNPAKTIKAPILIWYLELVRNPHQSQTWTLQKSDEHPVIFNEVLKAHLESAERIKTDDIEDLLEKGIRNEADLTKICALLLEKLSVTASDNDLFVKILPCTNKEGIEQLTKDKPWIRWSGVFGLYKTQKQPIIQDLQLLTNLKKNNNEPEETVKERGIKGDIITPVAVDPSQEAVLHTLPEFERIIIQGPPGTGKSQSLTAIITTALLHKRKVLVVCEKRTAMEVLQQNLKKEGLEHLVALIDDVYADRNSLVSKVRQWIDEPEAVQVNFRKHEYEQIHLQYISAREELNAHLNALHGIVLGDDNWMEILDKHKFVANQCGAHLLKIPFPDNLKFDFHSWVFYRDIVQQGNKLLGNAEAFLSFEKYLPLTDWLNIRNTEKTFQSLVVWVEKAQKISQLIQEGEQKGGSSFLQNTGGSQFWLKIKALFSKDAQHLRALQDEIESFYPALISATTEIGLPSIQLMNTENLLISDIQKSISKYFSSLKTLSELDISAFDSLALWLKYREINETGFSEILKALPEFPATIRNAVFEEWYLRYVIENYAEQNGLKGNVEELSHQLAQVEADLKTKIGQKIRTEWQQEQQLALQKRDISTLRMLYNLRKNKQFSSRNSLRQLLQQDFDFFSTVFPVLMTNPTVASSILPLQPSLYDLIILDEASQLRVEDTYPALYRAESHIISGDRHQMPPPSYFSNDIIFWEDEEEADEENTVTDKDNFLAESQSLLEFADDSHYQSTYLDFHYRSQHPDLIAFSNAGFYGSRLVPMPAVKQYQAIHFNAVNGVYANGINTAEAKEIVKKVFEIAEQSEIVPGIGIGTFNIHQRDYIQDLIWEEGQKDESKARLLEKLQQAGLFVKNLENIQGDERDIMLIGTTFGTDENGKFRQAFGPVSQEKGYRLLNVLITRAKKEIHVFTSIPETFYQFFEDGLKAQGNTGKSVLYAYLSFVRAVAEGNETRKEYVLQHLRNQQQHSDRKAGLTLTPPAFIEKDIQSSFGSQLKENISMGGFLLHQVLTEAEKPVVEISRENKPVHPNVAYRYKLYRKAMLERYGINMHPISTYLWWKNSQTQIDAIQLKLKKNAH